MIVDDKTFEHPPNGINKQQLYPIPCKSDQLLDAFVIKTKPLAAKQFTLTLLYVYACLHEHGCAAPTFTMISHPLFEELTIGKPMSTNKPFDKIHVTQDKIAENLHHIENILTDLKNHLVSQQEEYLKPIQSKTNNLRKIVNVIEQLSGGIRLSGDLVARKVRLSRPGNAVGMVTLTSGDATQSKNISTLYREMKQVNETVHAQMSAARAITKRSPADAESWSGDFLHVKRLYLHGEHPFKGDQGVITRSGIYTQVVRCVLISWTRCDWFC